MATRALTDRATFQSLVALAVGSVAVFHSTLLSGFDRIPGGRDSLLVGASLEHTWRVLIGAEPSLWDPPFFWPARNVAAYTDLLLGAGPFYWPWRLLGCDRDLALLLFLVSSFVASFLLFRWILRRELGIAPCGATFGAWLFAFGSPRVASIVHPQLTFTVYWVAALGGLLAWVAPGRSLEDRRLGISIFAIGMVLQAWTAFYAFFFVGFLTLVAAVVATTSATARRRLALRFREDLPVLVVTGLLAAAALAPLAEQYLDAARVLGGRNWQAVRSFLPRPISWLWMGPEHFLFGGLLDPARLREMPYLRRSPIGLGPVTTVLALGGFWIHRRSTLARVLAGTAFAVVVVSTSWPGGFSLWRWVHAWIPGASAVRAVARIGEFLLVPAAIGLAWSVAELGRRRSAGWLLALALILPLEHLRAPASFDRIAAGERTAVLSEAVERASSARAGGCAAFFAVARGGAVPTLSEDAMRTAQTTGVPTLDGRYGNVPPGWSLAPRSLRKRRVSIGDALEDWLERNGLDGHSICTVVVTRVPGGEPDRFEVRAVGDLAELRSCGGESAGGGEAR